MACLSFPPSDAHTHLIISLVKTREIIALIVVWAAEFKAYFVFLLSFTKDYVIKI